MIIIGLAIILAASVVTSICSYRLGRNDERLAQARIRQRASGGIYMSDIVADGDVIATVVASNEVSHGD